VAAAIWVSWRAGGGRTLAAYSDQGVEIGDGVSVRQFAAFDAQMDGLAANAFGSAALAVDIFVSCTVSIQFVAQAGGGTERQGGDAATLGPVRLNVPVGKNERAEVMLGGNYSGWWRSLS
jgi:hypothetical protein